jgi:citrate lyase subunit beta/citryl-CoA lyase
VLGLICGGEDLATAMGAEPTPQTLHMPKLLVHLAAKAAHVLSFGLLRSIADYQDADGVAQAAREARSHGFDGATCVHPSVVPLLNGAFAPDARDRDRARRLIAAFDAASAAGHGAFAFEGAMVDAPVVARARLLLGAG